MSAGSTPAGTSQITVSKIGCGFLCSVSDECVAVNECPVLRFHWKCSINYLQKTKKLIHLFLCYGVMAESADASDSKSVDGNIVWVQVPLAPSLKSP